MFGLRARAERGRNRKRMKKRERKSGIENYIYESSSNAGDLRRKIEVVKTLAASRR